MPPLPKNPKTRQRRNRTTTAAQFVDDGEARPKRKPDLPRTVEWHSLTRRWWDDLWASPMRTEYLRVDVHGLYRLAMLIDRFWRGEYDQAGEIRLQGQLFGLTPIDRRRLQWEIVRAEEATDRQARTRPPSAPVADPRNVLSVLEGDAPTVTRATRRKA